MGQIFEKINSRITDAMKAKRKVMQETPEDTEAVERSKSALNAYQNLKSKMVQHITSKNAKVLDDAAEAAIIKKMVKELKDDIAVFQQNKREELVGPATYEVEILEAMLPKEATEEDIIKAIKTLTLGSMKIPKNNMGIFISEIKSLLTNVDGKLVADTVKQYLV